jgi:hypothetical protein
VAGTGSWTTKTETRKPTTAVLVVSKSPIGVLLALRLLVAVEAAAAAAIMAVALVDSSLNVFVKLLKPILYHRS